jgi:WD40 repeat protein
VFRDQDELPASADLGAKLKESLEQSTFLIVICSPNAASSKWVNAEIEHFRQVRGADHILCVVIDGQPAAGAQNSNLEAFPPSLLAQDVEPLWVDARPRIESKERIVVRLAAGIIAVSFDDLWQRERRRKRLRLGVLTGGTLAGVCALVMGYVWNDLLTWRIGGAREALSSQMAQWSVSGFQLEQHLAASRYAVAALPPPGSILSFGSGADEARDLVERAGLYAKVWNTGSISVHDVAFDSRDNQVAAGTYDGIVHVWSLSGETKSVAVKNDLCVNSELTYSNDCSIESIDFSATGNLLAVLTDGGEVSEYETETWRVIFRRQIADCAQQKALHHNSCRGRGAFFVPNRPWIAIGVGDGKLAFVESDKGALVSEFYLHADSLARLFVTRRPVRLVSLSSKGSLKVTPVPLAAAVGEEDLAAEMQAMAASSDAKWIYFSRWGSAGVKALNLEHAGPSFDLQSKDCGRPAYLDGDSLVASTKGDNCEVAALAITRDDKYLAAGFVGGNIALWDLSKRVLLRTLEGHEDEISALRFDHQGRHLVSGSEDGTVRVWPLDPSMNRYDATDLRQLVCMNFAHGELAFPEAGWKSDWRLRIRNPDPCRWNGVLSWAFWKQLPEDILRFFQGTLEDANGR